MTDWIKYYDQRPAVAGPYKWRVPHSTLPGLVVTFAAHMHERSIGRKRSLYPWFSRWNGWKVTVPDDLYWTSYAGPNFETHKYNEPSFIGADFAPCPFCGGTHPLDFSGRFIFAGPHQSEWWRIDGCSMVGGIWGPRHEDPRILMGLWNKRHDAMLAARNKEEDHDEWNYQRRHRAQ